LLFADLPEIDATTASRMVLTVMASYCQRALLQRPQIAERTRVALAAAKARGVRLSDTRPPTPRPLRMRYRLMYGPDRTGPRKTSEPSTRPEHPWQKQGGLKSELKTSFSKISISLHAKMDSPKPPLFSVP
jgi:hypothetical protein